MAIISIKKIEPLKLKFSDGTIKKALFSNEAFVFYTEEFGPLDVEELREMKDKPYDLIARFLFCGMKVFDRTITLDEAEMIVVGGGEALAIEIVNLVTDNFMATADENSKKKFLKEINRYSKALME